MEKNIDVKWSELPESEKRCLLREACIEYIAIFREGRDDVSWWLQNPPSKWSATDRAIVALSMKS